MRWVWAVVAFLLLLDAWRLRGRARALAVLPPSGDPVSPEHRFVLATGVVLDEATRRAASAYARTAGLRVLDLWPSDLPALRAWALLQVIDPAAYRKDRLGKGSTAEHAVLVATDVLERAGVAPEVGETPQDPIAFVRLAARLKRYSLGAADLAVAPSLSAVPGDPKRRLALLWETMGSGANAVLFGVPVLIALLVLAAITDHVTGAVALVVFQAQPLLALVGGDLRPPDLFLETLIRLPLELWAWVGLLRDGSPDPHVEAARARRGEYDQLLAGGLARFFEPRAERCPLCQGTELEVRLETVDLLQHKPGEFTLERCRGCGHVFQNPRLSLEGLDFYYRDFYDGLGEEDIEAIFGASGTSYEARAAMVLGHAEPKRWLDVGGGHGHFCFTARELSPETRFDALDLSGSIDEAARRGWVDRSYLGLFPDLAPTLAGAYDVVSMSHYLEHTRDPRAELAAASVALAPGGLLLVEIPNPECSLGRRLGRLWLPWFQPQHQHLLSVANLEKLLREHGFSPLVWHRGEAHQPVDMFAAVYLLIGWLVPPPDEPWRPPSGVGARIARTVVFLLGVPGLLAGRVLDAALRPGFARSKASNTFRVLARKDAAAVAAAEAGPEAPVV
jgi:SAM-dependent methyltransferase